MWTEAEQLLSNDAYRELPNGQFCVAYGDKAFIVKCERNNFVRNCLDFQKFKVCSHVLIVADGKNCLESVVGWLVGCFGLNGPLRQYFSLYRAVSQREGDRGERIDESKNVQTTPPAPTASAIGPCPTVIKIVGRPGTGSLPSFIAPPDHLRKASSVIRNIAHLQL